jgi:hypothetical protein
MAQRFSEYPRRERNWYSTPSWVTEALLPHLPAERFHVWEPACGDGSMAKVRANFLVNAPVVPRRDLWPHRSLIATNPPYGLGGREAVAFIRRAIELTRHDHGCVAMLLQVDFDSGSSPERRALFAECEDWSKKIVLLERIMWFESPTGNGSSTNHAWFLWDHNHTGPATIAYADGPKSAARAAKRKGKEHADNAV